MSFMYINPGYGNFLDVAGATTVESAKYNPYGGVSFWQAANTDAGITLPEVPTEIYLKTSVAIRGGNSATANARVYAGNSNGWTIRESSGNWYLDIACGNTNIKNLSNADTNLNFNGMNDILLHAEYGYYEAGVFSLTVNGTEVFSANRTVKFTKDSSYATPSDVVVLYSKNEKVLLSNIIVSDTEVGCKEQVAILPATATDTDMTANGDGSYTATAAGQRFMQTIDASSLVAEYGGASNVTGLYIFGNPAYCTGAEITKAILCAKKDGAVTELATTTLTTDSTAMALIGGRVEMTLSDLEGYELGWKAGV